MTTRRGFLAGILASGFAPAVVGSSVLMPVKKIIVSNQAFSDFMIKGVYLKGGSALRISVLNEIEVVYEATIDSNPATQAALLDVFLTQRGMYRPPNRSATR